jgi:nicotinamidase-related amidase
MSKNALIVLDLQNCFITNKTKNLPQKIKKHIKKQNYDFVIFSKFINAENSNFVKKLDWHRCKKSPESDIVGELSEIASQNQIFEKQTYSIFKSKKFVDFLRKNKISKLYFCGLDTEACVIASAFEAFDLGFDYEILYDLTGSSAKEKIWDSANQIMKRNL